MSYTDWSALKDSVASYLLSKKGWKTPNGLKTYREEFYGDGHIVYFDVPHIVVISKDFSYQYCNSVEELRKLLEK